MRLVRRAPGLALVLLFVVFCGALSAAGAAPEFPRTMRGVWDGALPCDPGETSDRDSRLEITSAQRLNYEEVEDIVSVELLSRSPWAWRIVTTSNVGPEGIEQPFIYVLEGDLLAVNDGQSARMYMRCK